MCTTFLANTFFRYFVSIVQFSCLDMLLRFPRKGTFGCLLYRKKSHLRILRFDISEKRIKTIIKYKKNSFRIFITLKIQGLIL